MRRLHGVLGALMLALGGPLAVLGALLPCASNVLDARRLGEPWCGASHGWALAGLVLAIFDVVVLVLGSQVRRRAVDAAHEPESGTAG